VIAQAPRPTARKTRVRQMVAEMFRVPLSPWDDSVTALVQRYRDKFGLGPRDYDTERATKWFGMIYRGGIIAVHGERREGRRMEVTDAYEDGSRVGRIAFLAASHRYVERLQAGEYDLLVHTVLYANADHWQAVVRETGNEPYALIFLHRRAEVPNG
jgi:hypothetical protein